jgi:hypothetical protein
MPEATTMQLSNREGADDPLVRFREGWRLKARHAKNAWTPGTEPIETAMEGAFRDSVKCAVEFLEGEGHRELAGKLRAQIQPKI